MMFSRSVLRHQRVWGSLKYSTTPTGIISPPQSIQESPAAIMLCELDYPRNFRGHGVNTHKYAHPDDYKVTDSPIKPYAFLYKGERGRNRIFVRTSLKLDVSEDNSKFTSATFLLDTGCCPHFNICDVLFEMIKPRVVKDSSPFDYMAVNINGQKHLCEICHDLPDIHKPTNCMGVPMFFALGLKFHPGMFSALKTNDDRIVEGTVMSMESFEFL